MSILIINKAELHFKEAISIDKNFYEAYMMLGELMTKQRRFTEASANYQNSSKN